MSQNQEIIEAKLCAYIDDQLDVEGRAEIEKHLEANPQHRRLLESLRATRDLVRWLPREQAPPELAETLNGQLERSVLLNYGGDSLRPNFMPRILAAAAIVVLTSGLAVAVYLALPRGHKNATFAVGPSPSMAPLKRADSEPTLESTSLAASESGESRKRFEKPSFGKAGELDSAKADGSATNDSPLDQLAKRVAANAGAYVNAANNDLAKKGEGVEQQKQQVATDDAVVVLLHSDDPNATRRDLIDYLVSNQIQWKSADPAVEKLNVQDEVALKEATANSAIAPPSPVAPTAERPGKDAINNTGSPLLEDGPSHGQGAGTRPADAQLRQTQSYAARDGQLQNQSLNDRRAFANAGQNSGSSYRSNGMYVARMSRRQCAELTDTVGRDRTQNASAEVVNRLDGPAGNDQRAAALLHSGQVAVTPAPSGAAQNSPPGVARNREELAIAKSAAAGNIRDKFKPATTQPGGLNSEVAGVAGADAAKLGAHFEQNRGLDKAADPADRQLLEAKPGNGEIPATQQSQQSKLEASATLPASTEPADEAVDVVILVQPKTALPSEAATTQPADAASPSERLETGRAPGATAGPTTRPSK